MISVRVDIAGKRPAYRPTIEESTFHSHTQQMDTRGIAIDVTHSSSEFPLVVDVVTVVFLRLHS